MAPYGSVPLHTLVAATLRYHYGGKRRDSVGEKKQESNVRGSAVVARKLLGMVGQLGMGDGRSVDQIRSGKYSKAAS
jgi:hypothetical protein